MELARPRGESSNSSAIFETLLEWARSEGLERSYPRQSPPPQEPYPCLQSRAISAGLRDLSVPYDRGVRM